LYEELEDYDSKWIEELSKVVWGTIDSSKQSYWVLAFLPSIRIRSGTASRLDLDLIEDRAI
jgi:hypothetical protein